jgi:hypothetical protein
MRVYLIFVADDSVPLRVVAANKKAAHEAGQSLRPGVAVEVYSETELAAVQTIERETENIGRWLTLLRTTIDEVTDLELVHRRITSARKCLDRLSIHFSEVV